MKKALTIVMALALGLSNVGSTAYAADEEAPAKTLAELLEMVKDGKLSNTQTNARREREFNADKSRQASDLGKAKRLQAEEEATAERLENVFEKNEQDIAAQQEILAKRLGSLRELFGVLQQVAGDTQGVFEGSIVSAELPGRGVWLGEFAQSMGKSSKLASIEEIRRLWFELQREMIESAKITRFNTTVIKLDGEKVEQEVVRVGSFNLISGGEYVTYDIDNQIVKELPRQPASRYVDSADNLASSTSGFTAFGSDPTRGQLLALQVQVPRLKNESIRVVRRVTSLSPWVLLHCCCQPNVLLP